MHIKMLPEEQIDLLINKIESINLHSMSVEDIRSDMMKLTTGFRISSPLLKPPIRLFRARKYPGKNTRPLVKADLSYCPPKFTRHGRANRRGKTIFYGCDYFGAAFLEIDSQVGDFVAVGQWVTKADLQTNLIGYDESAFSNASSIRGIPPFAKQPEVDINTAAHQKVATYLHNKFVAKVPKGQEQLYLPSIAIAEYWLKPEFMHGLLYPAIAADLNSDNLAIKPSFVDNHMDITRADFYEITGRQGNMVDIEWIDSATDFEEERIIWKGHKDRYTIPCGREIPTFKIDDHGFEIAIDEYGQIIPPDIF